MLLIYALYTTCHSTQSLELNKPEMVQKGKHSSCTLVGNIQTSEIGHMTHGKVDWSETIEDDENVVVCQLGKTEVHTNCEVAEKQTAEHSVLNIHISSRLSLMWMEEF